MTLDQSENILLEAATVAACFLIAGSTLFLEWCLLLLGRFLFI